MKLLACLAVAILLAASPVAAADFDKGFGAYDRGDYATALKEFRQLAEQGNASAQAQLGIMYYKGQGVPQDYVAAVSWYLKAAEQGNVVAQNNLGTMYATGEGVPKDYAAAAKWFRKAAEQGNAKAQNSLGAMYDEGKGIPQDYVQAHKWWNLAASQGHKNAIKGRDMVAKWMTPAQIAEAQKLAREWFERQKMK